MFAAQLPRNLIMISVCSFSEAVALITVPCHPRETEEDLAFSCIWAPQAVDPISINKLGTAVRGYNPSQAGDHRWRLRRPGKCKALSSNPNVSKERIIFRQRHGAGDKQRSRKDRRDTDVQWGPKFWENWGVPCDSFQDTSPLLSLRHQLSPDQQSQVLITASPAFGDI